eukprot:scaffold38136_cov69-Cyclotella_meneghiniana.AAC.5
MNEEIPAGYVCTAAITGSHNPAHQAIYICATCNLHQNNSSDYNDGSNAFCICESCAETCHQDHDIEFLGMGPCTCDCSNIDACALQTISKEEASKLGFHEGHIKKLNHPIPIRLPPLDVYLPKNDTKDLEENDAHSREATCETVTIQPETLTQKLQCIECNSTMGGYTMDCYSIPELSTNEAADLSCRNLIRQAEALIDYSRDTFWLPIGNDDGQDSNDDTEWSDLEILARTIYLRHVNAYNLNPNTFETKDVNGSLRPKHIESISDFADETLPGAEWWVQVKPAGSSKAPVDLHYDKDEALAEAFCLGSFPTLSTVTYLTGDNKCTSETLKDDERHQESGTEAPTLVFPHTYYDEEEQPIPTMLLSRPVRGKHIVFDGRLLHGAPGHPALRETADSKVGSLRVTLLVNIWRTGRPAGVDTLPQTIRNKLQSVSREVSSNYQSLDCTKLEITKRYVPQYNAPSKLALAFSANNPMDMQIILPFVSKGATWIGDEKEEETTVDENDADVGSAANLKSDHDCKDADDSAEESEEEDELCLYLPQFASQDFLDDGADTAMFLFQAGNEARLVRQQQQHEL